ncbi:hypothetical protein [Luedemannella helvata]|uniref:Septum formation initiator n=1 Tax=Luedemannella helvata TaxID=349315 RepID=A0ABP4WAF9_9ACTN
MTSEEMTRRSDDATPTAEFAMVATRRPRGRAIALGVAAVATAAVAVGVAVAVVNGGGARDAVLSSNEVAEALGTAGVATPHGAVPSAPAGAAPSSRAVLDHPKQVTGGYLSISCRDGLAILRQWSPRAGYRVDDVVRGPARTASVTFESDTADDVEVSVTCPDQEGAVPTVTEQVDPDDHGGDDRDDDKRDDSGRDHPEDD